MAVQDTMCFLLLPTMLARLFHLGNCSSVFTSFKDHLRRALVNMTRSFLPASYSISLGGNHDGVGDFGSKLTILGGARDDG